MKLAVSYALAQSTKLSVVRGRGAALCCHRCLGRPGTDKTRQCCALLLQLSCPSALKLMLIKVMS